MLAKAMSITVLCLSAAACSGVSMDSPGNSSGAGGAVSGSSGGSPTSYESGYGVTAGSSDSSWDGQMDWGE
ncbi:hypothetical protein [Azospirillum agricola]|uniref:hypothetical protein n=1 Tax=Azospirillum agricola TaxID=1720247 RepID=UPI000A0F06F8|nr:hypothetical protein [Azospirillum agricola]SMH60608.1 hypothetical protein SAMN02982994_5633 [Azospirillum lipoferum]